MSEVFELDFTKICRTCLGEKKLQPLFKRCNCLLEEECISEMLNLCTLLQYSRNDGLPSQICQDCVEQIQNAYRFSRKCEKSNEILQACQKTKKPKDLNKRGTKTTEKLSRTVETNKPNAAENPDTICEELQIEIEYLEPPENQNEVTLRTTQLIILDSEEVSDTNQVSSDLNPIIIDTNQVIKDATQFKDETSVDTDQFHADVNQVSVDTDQIIVDANQVSVDTNQIIVDANQLATNIIILDNNHVSMDTNRIIMDSNPMIVDANQIIIDYDGKNEILNAFDTYGNIAMVPKQLILDEDLVSVDASQFNINTNPDPSQSIKSSESTNCSLHSKLITQKTHPTHLSEVSNHEITDTIHSEVSNQYITDTNHSEDPNRQYYSEDNNLIENSGENSDNSVGFQVIKTSKARKIKRSRGPPYECKKCFVTYDTFKELTDHHRTVRHPKNGKRPCHICEKLIAYTHFSTHVKSHKQERPFSCEICDAKFTLKPNLHRHMASRHSNDRPFKCEVCLKGFKRLEILKNHVLTHTGGTALLCNFCGKTYASVTSFRSHLSFHAKQGDTKEKLPELSYTCEVCEKIFATKTLLKVHQVIHGEKKFLCSVCGKDFFKKLQLTTHSRVHTGARPYSCDICGKKFGHNASLKNHKLVHSGVKPYKCKICEKSFTQHGHLESHSRTHSGLKPYSCNFCGKSFAISGNLTVHIRIHTGILPYVCTICEKGFNNSSSLKKHIKTHEEKKEIDNK